ncbi:glycosyltransferase involved in cell wall biogenesis-like protein [Desulforamulus reducens MI-1]|uniref:Glycosyltransferase involved in cell wall biogenesis-like protein n=1 Tax=Desulforamulus reducens (strain ATCC BAA-1160 / DSM 100696 / MI-1) TaxID=349161 RepID=A4J4C6_DESRM|nr:hypothetical protein [Desulforamulus reducens]ABO49929.1 glycosyltransferase involved in cell wall biogenesis-like protein [Desulforamulus reducens MI-1]
MNVMNGSMENHTVGLIFSKDRAMQLDATIRSLYLHCKDVQNIDLKILYKASDAYHLKHYNQLIKEYSSVQFISENNFREQVLSNLFNYAYILFLVDDNIFVHDFSINKIILNLEKQSDALGFSLRLGSNINYCYALNSAQARPVFCELEHETLKYDWTVAEHDFGYPLEVSSSVYRVEDILPLLFQLPFANPNTLEAYMSSNKGCYVDSKPYILCYKQSITFCNPVNKVQNIFNNRAGDEISYSIHELSKMFEQGYRIDVENYSGFIPNACHQEVKLQFLKPEQEYSEK